MILRVFIWILLLIVLPDIYIDRHYLRHMLNSYCWWKRLLWWCPALFMIVYTIILACTDNFLPSEQIWIVVYFYFWGIFIVPKFTYVVCSFVGKRIRKFIPMKINWGSIVGYAIAFVVTLLFFYSLTIGPRKLKVRHLDLTFHDLPESFEGYKIVQFSDAHIGTFNEVMDYTLKRDMDSIIAQNPDMVCFTGDLQNMEPTEIDKQKMQLSRLAALGIPVYSVLGNHDYSVYIKAPQTVKVKNETLLQQQERELGWTLLKNQNRKIYSRDKSLYLILAGEENGGDGKSVHSPAKADLKKTLSGTKPNDFIVMLQHDPKAWEEDILPHSHVQLTLSGHTHGGQIGIFGLRPTIFSYKHDYGLYEEDGRYLYVSGGLGGVIPIRFGITPEIVVITLHRK